MLVNTNTKIHLMPADFEKIFKEQLNDFIKLKIKEYDFSYYNTTKNERDACIKKIIETLIAQTIPIAGKQRKDDWERGWNENFKRVIKKQNIESIIPRYFGKYNVVRLNQEFIKPASKNFEYNMLGLILDWIFDKYIKDATSVYEFGCGTGYHLLRARKINQTANLWGLDWSSSSQKIITKMALAENDTNLFAKRFNFFKPDKDFMLEKDAIIYTVASLEQVGDMHKRFISYLLNNKPKLCIHIEPISELLDENNLLDYLSIQYFKKRKYLSGFLTFLRQLERRGSIRILKAQRTYIGSLFIEGYSVVVWTIK